MTRQFVVSGLLAALSVARPANPIAQSSVPGPGPRIGHSLVYDANAESIVLLDGYSWIRAVSPTDPPALTDVWRWNGVVWSRAAIPNGPASRTMSRAVYDTHRGRLVSYGGRVGPSETPSSETWELDGTGWRRIADDAAGPTVHVEMAYDEARRQTIRFGGAWRTAAGEFEWPTDTWGWNGSFWTRVAAEGPPGRAAANMVYDRARREIVLFGGQGAAPGPGQAQPVFNDTWIWNGRTWRLASREGPPARAFHAMSFDDRAGVVLLHGGNQGETTFGDLWAWNGTRWTELAVKGNHPGPRRLHAMAYDAARSLTLLYGGAGPRPGGGTDVYGDTWEWNRTEWTRR